MKNLIKFKTLSEKQMFKSIHRFIGYCVENKKIGVEFTEFDKWINDINELQKLAQKYISDNNIKRQLYTTWQ